MYLCAFVLVLKHTETFRLFINLAAVLINIVIVINLRLELLERRSNVNKSTDNSLIMIYVFYMLLFITMLKLFTIEQTIVEIFLGIIFFFIMKKILSKIIP